MKAQSGSPSPSHVRIASWCPSLRTCQLRLPSRMYWQLEQPILSRFYCSHCESLNARELKMLLTFLSLHEAKRLSAYITQRPDCKRAQDKALSMHWNTYQDQQTLVKTDALTGVVGVGARVQLIRGVRIQVIPFKWCSSSLRVITVLQFSTTVSDT